MDTRRIVLELKNERDRLDRAIAALESLSSDGQRPVIRARKARPARTARRGRRRLTAAGRKRLSDLMKQRWAERRRKPKAA